jgi:hypothetical protein
LGGGSSFSGGGSTLGGGAFSGGGSSFSGGSGFGGGGGYGGGAGGRGATGGTGGFQISPTNLLAGTYVNPMYYGRPGSSTQSMGSGGAQLKGQGFGQPSFGTVTTTTTTGLAGGVGGLGGRTGTASINRGLTGGVGGLGGMSSSSTPQVSYAATVGFRPPAVATTVVRADLQAMVNRSSALSRPGNIQVEAAGDVIVLRGKVANDDERRLIEGLVRLEPGVHEVRNELEVGP